MNVALQVHRVVHLEGYAPVPAEPAILEVRMNKILTTIGTAPVALLVLSQTAMAQETTFGEDLAEAIGFSAVTADIKLALLALAAIVGAFFVYRHFKKASSK